MKLRVDESKCQGHAMCHAVSEQLFPIDDAGYVDIDVIDVPDDAIEVARAGVDACPEGALSLDD